MPVAASQILNFIAECETFTVERYEVASPMFGMLRQSLRKIVLKLLDSDEAEALVISARLRGLLSEWLTVPVTFDRSMADAVRELFGGVHTVRSRWGADILALYETALRAAESLTSVENPVRARLREVIWELRSQGRSFKIYCHRRARPYFESLLASLGDLPLSESTFLHTVRDYRETEPFDVVIKIGPLRSRGWGSAPDALLTAPRFNTLVLIIWSGCGDEPGFGYDPSSAITDPSDAASVAAEKTVHGTLTWTERLTRTGDSSASMPGYIGEADELQIFRETQQRGQTRSAKLVQVDAKHGILFSPYSQVLSFDPTEGSREPIAYRTPGETLLEGMFVLMPLLDDVDLGRVQAGHGDYSRIWKAKLEQEWRADGSGLIERLRAAGLDLVHLASAITHWCRSPGTVIHAPQQIKHFEILIRVLGIDRDTVNGPRETGAPWWKNAWHEIRRSRGEAIQAGVLEHEIVEEQLLVMIRSILPHIGDEAHANRAFDLTIPAGSGMTGRLSFFPVCGIEEGFSVPENQLRIVHDLKTVDQWRD
jgi:hypothetical protein